MLVIRRTDGGALRLSDGRRTDTAASEEQARRVVTGWGYGNFSFNRALILMKEAEGSIAPVPNPWTARSRGAEPSPPAERPEPAAPNALKEPPTMNVPARSRRPRPADAPAPEETTPAPAPPVVKTEATVAETAARPRHPRKKPAAEAEPASVSTDAAQEPAAERPTAEVQESTPKGGRPRRARKKQTVTEPAAKAPAPAPAEEPEAKPAARPRRPRKQTGAEAAPVEVETAAAASAPEPAPARKRARRVATQAPTATRSPDEWLEAARALFAEGTQALRQIEGATLPFARGPWTELRAQSAEILACLEGERPPRS